MASRRLGRRTAEWGCAFSSLSRQGRRRRRAQVSALRERRPRALSAAGHSRLAGERRGRRVSIVRRVSTSMEGARGMTEAHLSPDMPYRHLHISRGTRRRAPYGRERRTAQRCVAATSNLQDVFIPVTNCARRLLLLIISPPLKPPQTTVVRSCRRSRLRPHQAAA